MRWPIAKGEVEQIRESEGEPIGREIQVHRSPGLAATLSHIDADIPCNILDLGPAIPQNIDFFSRFRCRLSIVDVLGRVAEEPTNVWRLENAPEDFFDEALPIRQRLFDLVLAWNVFDYLDRAAALHLSSRLAQLTRPGASLFAVVATGYDADSTGLTFAICEHDRLEYRPNPISQQRSSPYKPAAFAGLLEGFAIDHSIVLRHGFQEHVAVRRNHAPE